MKKVLIISYSFPPLNNIASRRFGEIVSHLSEYGWKPFILTTNSNGTLPIDISDEQVFRLGNHPQKTVQINNRDHNERGIRGIRRGILNVKRNLGFNLRLYDRTYFQWYKHIVKHSEIFKEEKFDLVLASYGPSAALFIGNYLSKKLKVPWIADFRDLGSLYKDDNFKQNMLFNYIDRRIETSLVSSASAITSIGTTLTNLLGEHHKKPAYAIYNGWEEKISIKPLYNSNSNYIYYAGRFYPHQLKSIFKVIKILSKFNQLNLVIRSLGPEKINKEILEYAKEKEVAKQVFLLEPVDQEIVLKESQLSLTNLVIEDLDKDYYWKKGTLTGKLLGLLPLKPPILAVARSDSEIGEILNYTGRGGLCSTETEIEEFLWNISNYSATSNISFYSKKNQAIRLVSIFNDLLDEK